jgi:hypothetical protein
VAAADAVPTLEAPSTDLATALAPPTPTAPSSSEPPPEDLTLGEHRASGPLMPYPLPPEIAADRSRPASQRPAAPPRQPRPDTGL